MAVANLAATPGPNPWFMLSGAAAVATLAEPGESPTSGFAVKLGSVAQFCALFTALPGFTTPVVATGRCCLACDGTLGFVLPDRIVCCGICGASAR